MTPAGFETARDAAIAAACASPCQKSRRGAALWTPGAARCWTAFNAPAVGTCDGSEACRASCRRICAHAEQVVLLQAGRLHARGAELLHIKVVPCTRVLPERHELHAVQVDTFEAAPSGPPSCAECSKLIVTAGVAGVWLFHEDGWKRYTAHDFHMRTLATLELFGASS